jgi:hypothetical protein
MIIDIKDIGIKSSNTEKMGNKVQKKGRRSNKVDNLLKHGATQLKIKRKTIIDLYNAINKGCVTLWPCHLHQKSILRQKKNYGKFKYFNTQKYNLQEKSLKNLSRYHNSITNLKFQHKPKISSFKNPQMKMDLLPGGQIHLRYYTL